ncbi:methyltransferase domain-containing protein [Candidatus Curtissbacteria bacterium]|nr:methyltransferase domain-containing protein [Candidatus Curtissbacteria bacterium]
MNDRLIYQEKDIADNSFSSSIGFEAAQQVVEFPKNLEGLTILDIGGGTSTVTLELTGREAKAIAIDYRYGNIVDLRSSVDRYLSGDLREKISEAQDEQSLKIILAPPPGTNTKSWPISIIRAWAELKESTAIDTAMENLSNIRFFAAYQRGQRPYVAGTASHLPFADNSVDFCFSIRCMVPFLVQNRAVFIQSIIEALRVLKPKGQLQIYPWVDQNSYFPQDIKQNASYALSLLRKEEVPFLVETTSQDSLPRLRITKP